MSSPENSVYEEVHLVHLDTARHVADFADLFAPDMAINVLLPKSDAGRVSCARMYLEQLRLADPDPTKKFGQPSYEAYQAAAMRHLELGRPIVKLTVFGAPEPQQPIRKFWETITEMQAANMPEASLRERQDMHNNSLALRERLFGLKHPDRVFGGRQGPLLRDEK